MRLVGWLVGCAFVCLFVDWLVGWLVGWLVCLLIGWLVVLWLVGWLCLGGLDGKGGVGWLFLTHAALHAALLITTHPGEAI